MMIVFLSRLNPVSVFHDLRGCDFSGANLKNVSIPPKSGLSFSHESEWIECPIPVVSIPPKSGLSFSRIKRLNYVLKDKMFLSRLNPVSVFHV